MNMAILWVATASGLTVWLLTLPPPALRSRRARAPEGAAPDRLRAWAPLWSASAAVAVWAFVDGPLSVPGALAAALSVWFVVRRSEPPAVRRRREEVRRDLPAFVEMFGAALASGAPIPLALEVVCDALPGPVAEELGATSNRLALGVEPTQVWSRLFVEGSALGELGRVMVRAHTSGAAVSASVQDLATVLAARGRAEIEDRARAVGVRAAVPLGLCLLPAFLLLGIVPLVAAAVDGLGW